MSNELKPCPFCGNKEVEWQESHVGFSIECYKCEFHVGGDLTLDAVEKLWNTRSESDRIAQLENELQAKTDFLALVVEEKQKIIDDKAELVEVLQSLSDKFEFSIKTSGRNPESWGAFRDSMKLLERLK